MVSVKLEGSRRILQGQEGFRKDRTRNMSLTVIDTEKIMEARPGKLSF
jgi:hypothetical protein